VGLRGLAGSRGLMPTAGSRPAPGITVAGCSRWAPVLSMLYTSVLDAVAYSAFLRSWASWAIRGGHVDAAHALRSSKKGGVIAHFVHPTVRCYRRAEQTRGYGTLGPGSVDPQCQNYPPHSTLPACSRGSTVHKLTAVRQLAKTVVSGRIGTK
jgi:hypothetical protein